MNENDLKKILKPVAEILMRGNTAEIKRVKDGVLVLEAAKRVAMRSAGGHE